MPEEEKTIKVVDRRLFTAEGELREDVKAELSKPDAPPPPTPEAAQPREPEGPAATNQAFLRLLDMLTQTAALYLEGIPDPATGRRQPDLVGARQIVDALAALREKTRGRLSFEEADALDTLLGELQLTFARLAGAGRPPGPPPAPSRRG